MFLQSKNHSTQDSRVVPHRGTNWAALRLTAQIGRDAVLSKSYGRGCKEGTFFTFILRKNDDDRLNRLMGPWADEVIVINEAHCV